MCGLLGSIRQIDTLNDPLAKTTVFPARDFVLEGLSALSYRGYDGWGLCGLNKEGLSYTHKELGKIDSNKPDKNIHLNELVGLASCESIIGHCRWGTHGATGNINNFHPIFGGNNQQVAVVHNGIFEDKFDWKSTLIDNGYKFVSDTDTEIIAHIIQLKNTFLSIEETLSEIFLLLNSGNCCLIVFKERPSEIYALVKDMSLVGSENGFFSSDVDCFYGYTDSYRVLENGIYRLNQKGLSRLNTFTNRWNFIEDDKKIANLVEGLTIPCGDSIMRKEIHEQPSLIKSFLEVSPRGISKPNKIVLTGCGSSYNAGLLGRVYFETISGIPTTCEYAADLAYRHYVPQEKTLFIPISQSGDSRDLLKAVEFLKKNKQVIFGITNNPNGQLYNICSSDLIDAGKEVAVAATKTFTLQCLYLLKLAYQFSTPSLISSLKGLDLQVQSILDNESNITDLADKLYKFNNALILGRHQHYPIALEFALKLKEVAYVHSEGALASEAKHGPLALIDSGVLSVFIVPSDEFSFNEVVSNVKEVEARNGPLLLVVDSVSKEKFKDVKCDFIEIPTVSPFIQPILANVALQLLAYYIGINRGVSVDTPRSIAKCITV